MNKKRKKLQFPYGVQAQYEHRTAADTHLHFLCGYIKNHYTPPFPNNEELKYRIIAAVQSITLATFTKV